MAGLLVEKLGKLLAAKFADDAPAPRPTRTVALPPRPPPRPAGPAPHGSPWDSAEAAALEPYFKDAACEHAVAAALVERLTGRSWGVGEDPLAARGHLWRDAAALPLLLSPSLLLRVSPPLALSVLAFVAAGVRTRLGNAEGARAHAAGARLARLLARLADDSDSGAFASDEAQAQSVPLADAALGCLTDVLSYHCGAEELQAALLLLYNGNPQGWLQPRALRCLAAVAAAPQQRPCFSLAGDAAGLAIDVQPAACSAATVLLWARVEAPPAACADDAFSGASPLFALRCADGGAGVAAALDADSGELQLWSLGADGALRGAPARSAPGVARRGAWFSLCVALQRSALLADTAVAYIDGVEVLRASLPFPAALSADTPGGGPKLRLFFGCWGVFNPASAADGAPAALPASLRGQLGASALFTQCAVSADEAAALHSAGCDGAPLAPPARTLGDRRSGSTHGACGAALPARLAEKGHRRVAFALDPRSAVACAAALPGRGGWGAATRARAPPAVELLPDTRVVAPRSLLATAAAAGGPALLLPLLASREAAVASLSPGASGDALQLLSLLPLPPPGRGLGPASLAALMALMPPLLVNARPGEAASASRAAAVLLRAAPAEALTPQLVAVLADVARALDVAAAAAGPDAPPAWEAAALLVLDVRWWRAAAPSARRALWSAMGAYLQAAPDDAAAALGGEHLCRSMRGEAGGGGDECAADERTALLHIVATLLAEGGRVEVRAAVARQLVRFVFAALPEQDAPPAAPAPYEALLGAAQLVVAELGREAAACGGGRAPPPLPREGKRDEWASAQQAPRGAGVMTLLQAGGGFVAAALARRLAAHPDAALAALARDVRHIAFNGDAAAASAAAAAAVHEGGPAVVAALLAGSAANAAARAGAAAAQAWAEERNGGGAFAWTQLRALRSGPGPWSAAPDGVEDVSTLPGGRVFWRLDDAACADGGRRRLLRLDRDASCAKAARVHDAAAPPPPAVLAAAEAVLPRTTPRGGADDGSAADEEAQADAGGGGADADLLDAGAASAGSESEAYDGEDDEDDTDEDADAVPRLSTSEPFASVPDAGEPPATPSRSGAVLDDDSALATPATPVVPTPAPPSESDGGGRSGADGPLSRLKRAAGARAGAVASGVAARAVTASRRAAEALNTAREASARVALASELVTEQLAFGVALAHAVTSSAPSAAHAQPLPPWAAAPPAPPRGVPADCVSFSGPAEWIRAGGVTRGTVCVVPGHLVFLPSAPGAAAGAAWPLALATGLQLRRRRMVRSGIELFLSDGRSALFNLVPSPDAPPQARPQALHAAVLMQRPPCMRGSYTRSLLPPPRLVERAGWTRAWQRRELSNFEYLMRLNEAAGRSFNDLSQYPVLPWVLADYESPKLDLADAASFRDLGKPMGAQTAARAAAASAAFAALEGDPDTPPFHHGTFYSSPGGVLHCLLRMAPFSALHVELQGGSFDHADRLLHGVGAAWHSAVSSSYDNRELPPCWFTAPAALRNDAALPLGTCQDGAVVGDVALPPWAGGSAEAFIRMHRAALESEHVSQHLHLWIDLIFGCKQRGPAAEAALNVYHYTSYEGEVHIAELADEHQRRIFADRCDNFGQVPMQLLRTPHVARGPAPGPAGEESAAVARGAHERAVVGVAFHPSAALVHTVDAGGRGRSFRLPARGARLALEAADGEPLAGVLPPGWSACTPARASAAGLLAASADFGAPGGGVLSAGWWDGAALCFGRDLRGKARPAVRAAQLGAGAASACLALDAGVLLLGAADGTASLWRAATAQRAGAGGGGPRAPERPTCVLRGHGAPLTGVALAARADTAATGAADGSCALHALASGAFVRALPLALLADASAAAPFAVAALAVSCDGAVAVQLASAARAELQLWSVNGVRIAATPLPEPLLALAFAPDGRHLLTAGRAGAVLRAAHTLDVAAALPAAPLEDAPPLASAAMSPDGAFVVVGLADGSVALYRTPQLGWDA